MARLTKEEREIVSRVNRRGGKALYRKYGKGHMSKLGKRGAKSRWDGAHVSSK